MKKIMYLIATEIKKYALQKITGSTSGNKSRIHFRTDTHNQETYKIDTFHRQNITFLTISLLN